MFVGLIATLLGLTWTISAQNAMSPEDDLISEAFETNAYELFHEWMIRYDKVYNDIITTWERFKVFRENIHKAIELNFKHGGQAYFGLTQFADLTTEEFASAYLMQNITRVFEVANITAGTKPAAQNNNPDPPPESVDWTKENVVTSIKDQGRYGTCYIFAALAVIESRWAQKGKGLVSLSTELVADCLAVYGGLFSDNLACGVNGGLQPAVYRYVKDQGGIASEETYPYCLGSGDCKPCAPKGYNFLLCGFYPVKNCKKEDSCDAKFDKSKFVQGLQVKSWSYISEDEGEIAAALAEEGPLSTGLDATDLQLYKGGILQPDRCQPDKLNHAVVLVGYGQASGTKYWKVKNSWGSGFGEDGYFRIARDVGACGINRMVTTVDLEE